MNKKYLWVLLILVMPAFSLMLKKGIYTMHDFHVFRQQQFDKCLAQGYFPCRWSFDAGFGYGEPVFNFYGQFPYWIGQIFHASGLQIIDSVKANFILTLVVSAVAMFWLARKYWGNLGGLISALFYVYAPYRAVDIWVRGSLNEAYALALFPLIFLFLDNFLDDNRPRHLLGLILSATALLITHNISALMITPFLAIWVFKKFPIPFSRLIAAGAVVFLLSAFYLLPVIFESHLVTLNRTTADYYSYQLHWTTLKQLFVSRFWGYGGSTWGPNDTMSFSVGYLQWLIPIFLIFRKKSLMFTAFGFFAIFLTHGKSEFIWKLFPPLAYIQFPWRFLAVATFFLALSSGAVAQIFPKKFLVILISLVILINFSFFRPDIWRSIGDKEQFSGALWNEQRSSALQDFWPKSASQLPADFAFSGRRILLTTTDYLKVQYPIVYFPGWTSQVELFSSGPLGLVTARVPLGTQITLKFTDTPVRTIGNIASLLTLLALIFWKIKYAQK